MIKSTKLNIKIFFENARKENKSNQERLNLLTEIANKIVDEYKERERLNINFICTHNSRRSQLAQVWSFFAINYFKLKNIFSYSGGTEVTAFHRNTVKCLQNTGFNFNIEDFSHQNPKYLISFKNSSESILGFSKIYNHKENPYPYLVITTCDSADKNCPFIPDAIDRFHLPFIDPKKSDNTSNVLETYTETSKQIAGEIYLIFEEVKHQLETL